MTLTAVDVGGRMGPSARHLAGVVVPAGAATGVIGIRVGMEGSCVCAGATGAIVGGIHYAATAAAEDAGYVTIVFLDASGKGIRRDNVWFTPSTVVLGTVQTDAHGAFRLALRAHCPELCLLL